MRITYIAPDLAQWRHGGKADIGAMGDNGREQRAVLIAAAGFIATKRLKGLGKSAPFVDIEQQILDADARQA